MKIVKAFLPYIIAALLTCQAYYTAARDGESYAIRNSIPNQYVTAFSQDMAGYMWIATAKGLCRYNGYEYFHYYSQPANPASLPSDLVTALYIDEHQRLWIATDMGLCMYNRQTDDFTRIKYGEPLSRPAPELGMVEFGGELFAYGMNGLKKLGPDLDSAFLVEGTSFFTVQTAIEDDMGRLWLGGRVGQGLMCLDKDMSRQERIRVEPSLQITCSFKPRNGELWFGTNRGILAVDPVTGEVIPGSIGDRHGQELSRLYITSMIPAGESEIIIGTESHGAFVYNFMYGSLERYHVDDFDADGIRHITSLFSDRDENIWLGTFERGYFIRSSVPKKFNNDMEFSRVFDGKFVTRLCEDAIGNIWAGTRHHGFIHYDVRTKRATQYDRSNFEPLRRSNTEMIHSLFIDPAGNLWIGYDKYLVWCRLQGSRILAHKVFEVAPETVSIAADDSRRVWVGSSNGGITVYDIDQREEPFAIELERRRNNITNIMKLRSGEMMFSAYDRGVYIVDPHTLDIRKVAADSLAEAFMERAIYLYENPNSEIWIGTYGKGLMRYNLLNDTYSIFTPEQGLCSNDIVSIAADTSANLWMSTSYGISKFDRTKVSFTNYFDYDGTGGNQFHEKSVLASASGKLYFGGNHGVTYFDPGAVTTTSKAIPVILEALKIMNIDEYPGKEGGVLERQLSQTRGITLSHRQNVFSIDYAGLDYNSSRKIRYAYMLRPFDRDWNYVNDYRRATYSNLAPGNYVFEVKAQNSDGAWNEIPTSLAIRVKAAPWLSIPALLGYILLALLLVFAAMRIYISMKLGRERIALVEREREHEKSMNDLKIRFFTNISHELRTPLTMIYGPVKKLREGVTDSGTAQYLLGLVNYNVDNLLQLIDQQIDFVKLESDTLELAVTETDITSLTREIMAGYSFYAGEKEIEMRLDAGSKPVVVTADADKYRKILGNLLSNALKYTPHSGHVTVTVGLGNKPFAGMDAKAESGTFLNVEVIDDGIGMKKEDLAYLFHRYRRFGTGGGNQTEAAGKGIGLNYVWKLVQKHKGTISASRGEECGMVFAFSIPADRDAYLPEEFKHDTESGSSVDGYLFAAAVPKSPDSPDTGNITGRKTILIAEDNRELREFICRMLAGAYNVVAAADGTEGLTKCMESEIDLIISDILMPGTDGLELCSKVKGDPGLCHIPFIFLTARAMDSNLIEGYVQGADAYITKPFNPQLLEAVIENTFANLDRRRISILKSRDDAATDATDRGDGFDTSSLSPMDRRFLEKLYTCIDRDLSNSSLNVNTLGRELAFSRTSFYRKIKALTGESPNDFLRIYRLNKAAELLDRNEFSINEIVDMTGFGTHSHFSHCFKKQFGINPKDYRKRRV